MNIVYIEDNALNFRLVQRMLRNDAVIGAKTGKKRTGAHSGKKARYGSA